MVGRCGVTEQRLDYDAHAQAYAESRRPNPDVLAVIQDAIPDSAAGRVLEVGVGAGAFLSALQGVTARIGLDPSRGMLAFAASEAGLLLVQAACEAIPLPSDTVDLAYSVDVIHHIVDRDRAASELFRILVPGGRLLIATDSHDDIAARIPLASHFPETIPVERRRYPPIDRIESELAAAGFEVRPSLHVSRTYLMTDIRGYESRSYSSLLLISDEAHRSGVERLRSDLIHGPIEARTLYTIVVAEKPAATSIRF